MELNFHLAHWRDYLALSKPKISLMIVFTAIVGMLLSTSGPIPPTVFILASLGIWFAAAAAATVNHIVDLKIDAVMARTISRPLPQGNISLSHAIWAACFTSLLSMLILIVWVNVLTAVLTALSLIGYGFVYSMYLKRATPQNIVIGGAAGAAPPILGWSAVTGTVEPNALLLFLIIFVWTPPHFWALAIYRRSEYARADMPMLPVTHGLKFTRLQILLYTIMLFLISLLPYLTYMSGTFYLLCALLLSGGFMYSAIRMQFDHSDRLAKQMFNYSIIYLLAIFSALLIDHYIPYSSFFDSSLIY